MIRAWPTTPVHLESEALLTRTSLPHALHNWRLVKSKDELVPRNALAVTTAFVSDSKLSLTGRLVVEGQHRLTKPFPGHDVTPALRCMRDWA